MMGELRKVVEKLVRKSIGVSGFKPLIHHVQIG